MIAMIRTLGWPGCFKNERNILAGMNPPPPMAMMRSGANCLILSADS